MPPPPPPPGQQQQQQPGGFQQQQQPQYSSATPKFQVCVLFSAPKHVFSQQVKDPLQIVNIACVCVLQELGWREIKDRYVRPSYLPASFALGALTIGLRLGAANYTFTDNVSMPFVCSWCCCRPQFVQLWFPFSSSKPI
jgi:hypothetical protein